MSMIVDIACKKCQNNIYFLSQKYIIISISSQEEKNIIACFGNNRYCLEKNCFLTVELRGKKVRQWTG